MSCSKCWTFDKSRRCYFSWNFLKYLAVGILFILAGVEKERNLKHFYKDPNYTEFCPGNATFSHVSSVDEVKNALQLSESHCTNQCLFCLHQGERKEHTKGHYRIDFSECVELGCDALGMCGDSLSCNTAVMGYTLFTKDYAFYGYLGAFYCVLHCILSLGYCCVHNKEVAIMRLASFAAYANFLVALGCMYSSIKIMQFQLRNFDDYCTSTPLYNIEKKCYADALEHDWEENALSAFVAGFLGFLVVQVPIFCFSQINSCRKYDRLIAWTGFIVLILMVVVFLALFIYFTLIQLRPGFGKGDPTLRVEMWTAQALLMFGLVDIVCCPLGWQCCRQTWNLSSKPRLDSESLLGGDVHVPLDEDDSHPDYNSITQMSHSHRRSGHVQDEE